MQASAKSFLKSSLFFVGATLWFLFLQVPLWQGYLATPNRFNLLWDPAVHIKEGLELYQQFVTFDFISFINRLMSLEGWLLTHRILEFVAFFFTKDYEAAAVFVNFAVFAATFSFLPYLLSGRIRDAVAMFSVSTFFAAALLNAPLFISLHNNIMLETLAFCLTLVFLLAAAQHIFTQSPRFHKIACVVLALIFFTKIHYGLFILPVWILFSWPRLWIHQHPFNWKTTRQFLYQLFLQPYFHITMLVCTVAAFLIILQIKGLTEINLGSIHWDLHSFMTTTWPIFFAPLLIWTVEWARGKNFIVDALSTEGRRIHNWVLFPFAWYYLIPGYQKVNFLLANVKDALTAVAGVTTHEFKLGYTVDWTDVLFHQYLGIEAKSILAAGLALSVVFCFATLIFWKRSPYLKALAFLSAQFLAFWFFLFYINHMPFPRLAVTWIAEYIAILFWLLLPLAQRVPNKAAGFLLVLSFAGGIAFHQRTSRAAITDITIKNNLELNFYETDDLFQCMDPLKPGIIYGLGYHTSAPLFLLWVKRHNVHSSSLFLKGERFFATDLGWGWKESPKAESFILDKFHTGQYRQFAFFKIGINPEMMKRLIETITSETRGEIKILKESNQFIFLADPAVLKDGCALKFKAR